jgi:hypothetical protein
VGFLIPIPDSKAIGEKIDEFFEINEDYGNAKE